VPFAVASKTRFKQKPSRADSVKSKADLLCKTYVVAFWQTTSVLWIFRLQYSQQSLSANKHINTWTTLQVRDFANAQHGQNYRSDTLSIFDQKIYIDLLHGPAQVVHLYLKTQQHLTFKRWRNVNLLKKRNKNILVLLPQCFFRLSFKNFQMSCFCLILSVQRHYLKQVRQFTRHPRVLCW